MKQDFKNNFAKEGIYLFGGLNNNRVAINDLYLLSVD
jgi:hypothetical protein